MVQLTVRLAGMIAIVQLVVAVLVLEPLPSWTRIVNEKVPAAVGVPLMTPVPWP